MKVRFGLRQALVSSAIFAAIVIALVSVDPTVRDRVNDILSSGSATSWTDQAAFMSDAVVTAAAHQSLENAPLVIFATAGALLFLFMART